jgi:hypothetical protein
MITRGIGELKECMNLVDVKSCRGIALAQKNLKVCSNLVDQGKLDCHVDITGMKTLLLKGNPLNKLCLTC